MGKAVLVIIIGGAAMCTLMGCDKANDLAKDVDSKVHDIADNARKEWSTISKDPRVEEAKDDAQAALRSAQAEVKNASATAEHQWTRLSDEARSNINTKIHNLVDRYSKRMSKVQGSYVIPAKCALGMATGAGAVAASSGLALAAFGFGAEGVELGSLAAMWQSTLGDVEEGSLFARMQSLGTKGLSVEGKLVATGLIATPAAVFCGVLDDLCDGCVTHGVTSEKAALEVDHPERYKVALWAGASGVTTALLAFVCMVARAVVQRRENYSDLKVAMLQS